MTNSRNTIQRQLVLSAVRQLQNHPTADEFIRKFKKTARPSAVQLFTET